MYIISLMSKKKSIAVLISGGKASYIVASLLKKQGHNVKAVYIELTKPEHPLYNLLNSLNFVTNTKSEDLKTLYSKQGIPFFGIDASSEYEQLILNSIISARIAGESYEYDISTCKLLLDIINSRLSKLKCDYIALGMFAKVLKNNNTGDYEIYKSNDLINDQSFLLSKISQNILSKLILPCGDLKLTEVDKLYNQISGEIIITKKKLNLFDLYKKDEFRIFLSNYIPNSLKQDGQLVIHKEEQIVKDHEDHTQFYLGQDKIQLPNINIDKDLVVYNIKVVNGEISLIKKNDIKIRQILLENIFIYPSQVKTKPIKVYLRFRDNSHCLATLYFKSNQKSLIVLDEESSVLLLRNERVHLYNNIGSGSKLICAGDISTYGYLENETLVLLPKTKTKLREEALREDDENEYISYEF